MVNIADPSAVILLHKVHPLLDLLNLVPSPIFFIAGGWGAAPAQLSPEFRENRILSLHCLCMAWGTRISNISYLISNVLKSLSIPDPMSQAIH